MGNSCASKPKLPALIDVVLQDIFSFFPALKTSFVLRDDGSVVAAYSSLQLSSSNPKDKKLQPQLPPETTSAIEGLKKSATSFGTSLFHGDSAVMHIRGKLQMFSYYLIENTHYYMVLYSEISPNTVDVPDMDEIDSQMEVVCRRIADLIRASESRKK